MRRSDIFRTLTACIIVECIEERKDVADLLRSIGCKDLIYFDSLKDAVKGFLQYHAKIPDFIVSTPSDRDFIDLILTGDLKKSVLHRAPLIIISNEDNPLAIDMANLQGASQFLVAPVSKEILKTSIMHVFRRKFKL